MRWTVAFLLAGLMSISSAQAQSPVPIESVVPLAEIELLVNRHVRSLEKSLSEEDRFEGVKNKTIRTDFGMLSLLGQSLAEHAESANSKINGPALRDAALGYNRKGTHAEAKEAFEQVQNVLAGNVTGEHARLHPWNKLINMHPMMEEMNAGTGALTRVLRKTRGKPEEVLPATSWSLLAIAMKADTHEVKKPDDLPKWNGWSDEFLESSRKLAEAIRARKEDEGRKWFEQASQTCDACHEVFRD